MISTSNRRFIFTARSAASFFVAGAAFSGVAAAQQAPMFRVPSPPIPLPIAPQKMEQIRLRNVAPSLMAWWLDPGRESEPVRIQSSREARANNLLFADKANPKEETSTPPLPAGISRIIANDPQSTLLAYGTDAGIAALKKAVSTLDRRQQQVEIEAEFVQIAVEEAQQLDIQRNSKQRYEAVPVSAKALTQLAAWKKTGKAKVLTAPRVTAINKLTAGLSSVTGSSALADIQIRYDARDTPINFSGEGGMKLQFSSKIIFTATPTINANDSITLQLAPAHILEIAEPQRPASIFDLTLAGQLAAQTKAHDTRQAAFASRVLEGAFFETTVQDKQTIALTGYTSHFGIFGPKEKPAANAVVFVTARIVRFADDDAQRVALNR